MKTIAQANLLRIIDELIERSGGAWGSHSAAARTLGIHRSTLLKLRTGERDVTATLIERVRNRLDLPMSYFETPNPAHHSEYVGVSDSARAPKPAPPLAGEVDVIAAVSALDRAAWLRVRAWADAFFAATETAPAADGKGSREGAAA